jgi:hypothetical protein
MRSRDGNNYLSFAISVVFLYSLAVDAGEYLISYRYVVKDLIIYNESLLISHAMTKCDGDPQKPILLPRKDSKDLKTIIDNNFEEFIDYIHKIGLEVSHKGLTVNAQNTSTTILTLKTTCFKVDFNDNFAKISPLN